MLLKSVVLASALAASALAHASNGLGQRYLFGEDGMGKMVEKRRAKAGKKTKTSSSSSTTTTSSTTKSATTTVTTTKSSTSTTTGSSSTTSTSLTPDAVCTNSPDTRSCWEGGYSIATDFDQKAPTTGNTVSYNLELTQTNCNPDGNGEQPCVLINGIYPGPTIFATWGDQVDITVTNSMTTNGTSLHWHGIRQLNSCGSDGVGGITECPIAPGSSFTYSFHATQYGTSWYHSHHSSQYGMGAIGAIQIAGPTTDNYDVDLGTITINDWYYQDAWVANIETMNNLQVQAAPPAANNVLVNGTGKAASGAGSYAQYTVQSGKTHLLRVINPSVDNFMRFSLDGHPFTVVSADFIPVKPIANQTWIVFGPGQRYNVLFTADQTPSNYYFRAEVAGDCLSANNGHGRAVFTYEGVTAADPVDSDPTVPTNGCAELVTVPYWPQAVTESTFTSQVKQLTLDLTEQASSNGQNLVYWALNFTSMSIDWSTPTLEYVMNSNTSYPASYDVITIPEEGVWTYWIIQSLQATAGPTEIAAAPPPHPIHLHGHDFFVLGSGPGAYSTSDTLNFANPPRRDTSTLPSQGWLALAFEANNPGAWLMHCHIAWHISEGLGVQFLEAPSSIVLPSESTFNSNCAAWRSWYAGSTYKQDDSGL